MFKRFSHLFNLNNGVLLVALLIAVGWLWGTLDAIQKNFVLQQKVDNLQQEITYQELVNQTLGFQNQYFHSREYLELSARQRLNKAANGEKVVILQPNTVSTPKEDPASTPAKPLQQRNNLEQWWYFLFVKKKD